MGYDAGRISTIQYNTIIASKVACESEALHGSEPCYVLCMATENSAVFKRDLKEARDRADRRSSSRKFHT